MWKKKKRERKKKNKKEKKKESESILHLLPARGWLKSESFSTWAINPFTNSMAVLELTIPDMRV